MQLVRQCKDTFIRKFGDIGYITNQLTKHDRVYDEIGAVFLDKISRIAKPIEEIVDEIYPLFVDISKDTIYQDFVEFVNDLEDESFLVTGASEQEIDRKDQGFSYKIVNPKTIAINFLQQDKNPVLTDTANFFYDYFRDHPRIFGMHMEVASRCNERCLHCYIPHEHKTRVMALSLAIDVLDQLQDMGTVGITFSGGEPFYHPQIKEMLRHARKNDFSINILTNALLLNKDLISVLKEINVNMIQVSLYSMDPEKHDTITQVKGSHSKTLLGIEKLIDADIPVQISCPIMKLNKDSYKDVSLWAKKHNVRVLSDFIMMAKTDFDTSNLVHRLNIEETEQLISDIISVDDEYKELLELEPDSRNIEQYGNQPVCGVGIDNACITADGNLYPCAGFQGYALGNANDQSLKEIWKDSEKLKFLRSIKNSSFPQCMECLAKDYCAMCLVRNFNENNGDVFKINEHFCNVAFLTKKLVEESVK